MNYDDEDAALCCRYSKIRTKSISNYYLLNLAAADELLLWTLPLYCVSSYTSDWMFGQVVCKMSYVFRESNKYTGILTLVALSVDRCLASYHSTVGLRRVRVGVGVCVGVWLVSLLASLPYAINAAVTVSHSRRRCSLVWQLTTQARRAWTYSQLTLGLALPLAVIVGANAVLVYRLRRRSASRPGSSLEGSRRTGSSGGLPSFGPVAMAKLVIIVVGVFVGCQLPYHVVEIMSLTTYERYSADGSQPSTTYRTAFIYINTAAQLLVYVSSCFNPIIYGIFNQNYRKPLQGTESDIDYDFGIGINLGKIWGHRVTASRQGVGTVHEG